MLTTPQQIHQLLEHKKHILVTFRQDAPGDAIASAAALFLFLKKQGKPADIICDGLELPKQFRFLPGSEQIKSAPGHLQKFVITLDVKDTGVDELSYDLKDEKLRIHITPKKGFLTRDNVRTAQSDFTYDLIFVLDTPDLEALGGFYDSNTELFHKTPIINIDHDPGNERFGQINVIDLTVASTAEVLFDTITQLGQEYVDESVATAILTGMIAKTRSFKSDNIKPHTLATAGKLMSLGADREKIIANLYRTRSVSALKLWGQALAHLQHDAALGLVWTTITREDFVRSGAAETDLKDVIDEIIGTSPEAKLVLILHEHSGGEAIVHGILRSFAPHLKPRGLLESLAPQGTNNEVSFTVKGKGLKEVEREVVEMVKKSLKISNSPNF